MYFTNNVGFYTQRVFPNFMKNLTFLFFYSLFFYILFFNKSIFAQSQDYIFPIKTKPGQAYIAGNMGEIRGQHFHLGLDIGAMTGTEVLAVADGYAMYAEVSPVSYGKLLIIYHPTLQQKSVYAHLDDFAGNIGDFIRKTQISEKKTEVKIDFPKEKPEFLVKKGQVIGYVGNTGISGGAHLHFEIREKNDIALNHAIFGFKEMPFDNLPPNIKKIAVTPLQNNARVEGEFLKHTFIPEKTGRGTYQLQNPIKVTGEIGLEVFAEDIIPNSPHTFSILKIELLLGENDNLEKYWVCDLQKIDYTKNRVMLTHIAPSQNPKDVFQKCYVSDGNILNNYPIQKNKGKIQLKDGEKMNFSLILYDEKGNKSVLKGVFLGEKLQKNAVLNKKSATNTEKPKNEEQEDLSPKILYEIHENTLKITTKNIKELPEDAFLTFKGMRQNAQKAYQINTEKENFAVYIWDLRDGLPDGIEIGEVREPLFFRKTIYPNKKTEKSENNKENFFEMDFFADENEKIYNKIRINFNQNSLFDTLYLELKPFQNGFWIGDIDVPLWNNINIQYFLANENLFNEKQLFYFGHTQAINTNIQQKGIFEINTRKMGGYYLLEDHTPPSVQLASKNPFRLNVSDKGDRGFFGSGIASYQANLNGKFVILEYEPKENKLFIRPSSKEPPLSGKLEVKIKDLAGNEAIMNYEL